MRNKKILPMLLSCLILSMSTMNVSASELSDAKASLATLQQSQQSITTELDSINEQLSEKNNRIEELEKEIETNTTTCETVDEKFKKIIQDYMTEKGISIDLSIDMLNYNDEKIQDYMSKISEYLNLDIHTDKIIENNIDLLHIMKANLDKVEMYQEQIEKMNTEKESLVIEKSNLEQMKEEKETELNTCNSEITTTEEKINSLSVTSQTSNPSWNGSVLSKRSGVNYGPSGKETYYNLNMNGVVNIMRGMGNYDEYWVRNDGCKMLGNYIMVAANLSVHPRGSLVETSLGTGIVCDTGSFASGNPNQIDIATTW